MRNAVAGTQHATTISRDDRVVMREPNDFSLDSVQLETWPGGSNAVL